MIEGEIARPLKTFEGKALRAVSDQSAHTLPTPYLPTTTPTQPHVHELTRDSQHRALPLTGFDPAYGGLHAAAGCRVRAFRFSSSFLGLQAPGCSSNVYQIFVELHRLHTSLDRLLR